MFAATQETSFLAPKHSSSSVYGENSALCYCLEFNPLSIACESVASAVEPFWTQERISTEGLVLESRSRYSSTERGLAFIFHLAETKNWG